MSRVESRRRIGNNVIEGISRGGKSVGYAILKPNDVSQLNRSMRSARVQPQRRARVTSGLSRYSARPSGVNVYPAFMYHRTSRDLFYDNTGTHHPLRLWRSGDPVLTYPNRPLQ